MARLTSRGAGEGPTRVFARENFLYWLKRASGACPPLAGRDPRAPGMRRWRAGPSAHPHPAAGMTKGAQVP
jgi:hypothetical protein